jgi:hypothetical protein
MTTEPLSYRKVNPRKFKPHKLVQGYQAEQDMPEDHLPYIVKGIKQCRRYVCGVGFQQVHEVMVLRS